MRYIFFLILVFIFPFATSAYPLVTKIVDGHKVRVFVIPPDDEYRVTVSVSNTGTTLSNLISLGGGVAGINGAYFIPHDYTGQPSATNAIRIMNGDGFRYSRYFPDTGINGLFGFLSDSTPILIQNNIYGDKSLRDNYDANMLLEVRDGIANFPILLASGTNLVPRYENAGYITEKMKSKTRKSFICRTNTNTVKMGTIDAISLLDVPTIIQKFSCLDAINLDNGGSTAMMNQGKYILGPGRDIMDAFIIVKK